MNKEINNLKKNLSKRKYWIIAIGVITLFIILIFSVSVFRNYRKDLGEEIRSLSPAQILKENIGKGPLENEEIVQRSVNKADFEEGSYKISGAEQKLKEKGFDKLKKDSLLFEESVVIQYNKKLKDYPIRVEFGEGLPASSSEVGVTGDIISDFSDSVIINEAERFFDEYQAVFGVDSKNLEEKSRYSVGDLEYLSLGQKYNGIFVYSSNILLVQSDNKWMLASLRYFNDINLDINAKINENEAGDIAKKELFINKEPEKSELVVYPYLSDKDVEYYLAYKLDFPVISVDGNPSKPSIFVDAVNGKVVDIVENVRVEGVRGNIYGYIFPDHTGQPKEERVFANEYLDKGAGITDASGDYSFSIDGDSYFTKLEGPYVVVLNDKQDEAVANINVPPYVNNINWDLYDGSYRMEESNVFYHTNKIHDFFAKGQEPFTISELDYQMQANVELSGTCNAFATGTSINFYAPGGGCEALSLSSDVIYHEYTHNMVFIVAPTLSEVYRGHTGNMNEGYADYYACSLNNNPCLSDWFFYGAYGFECLRNCENTKKYPEDYGDEPHYAAEIISGSLWDIRKQIGQQKADTLALVALSYDPQTFQELADNFLISDDAIYGNADLSDGSPNGRVICNSFYINHGIYSDYCFNVLPLVGQLNLPEFPNKISGDYLKIIGTAGGTDFDHYTLYYQTEDSKEWNEIFTSYSPVSADVLYPNFDLTLLNEGYNSFKIEVYGSDSSISFTQQVYVDNIKVKSPLVNDIYRSGDVMEIKAEIGIKYDGYTIEWGKGEYPYEWFSQGISIPASIENNIIGTWDSGFADEKGFYAFRITFNNAGRHAVKEEIKRIYFDPTLKEGWPQHLDYYFCEGCRQIRTAAETYTLMPKSNSENNESFMPKTITREELMNMNFGDFDSYYYWAGMLEPVVADIDKDGDKEIVVYKGGFPPEIVVYNPDGSIAWLKGVGSQGIAGGNLHIPLVGDINNDGYLEIIAINPNYDAGTGLSELYAFNKDGDVLWQSDIPLEFSPTLAMADLNLDENQEIIIKGNNVWHRMMTVVNSNGEIINSWALENPNHGGSIYASPAVGNFDDDPELEIVSASPSFRDGYDQETGKFISEGVVYVYNLDGSAVNGWPVYTPGYIFSSPAVGDINNDGKDEIVVGLMYSSETFPDLNYGGVYAFSRDGSVLPGWPVEKGWNFWSAPSLADFDNNGDLEIVFSRLGFVTYLYHHDGSLEPNWPQYTSWNDYYSSIIGDINGDDRLDILTTAGGIYSCPYGCGGVYAWDFNGNLLEGFPKVTEVDAQAPATIDDIDKDGKLELIASSDWDTASYPGVSGEDKHRDSLYVWELDGDYNKLNLPWHTFHHDIGRTGLYSFPKPISKLKNNYYYPVTGNLVLELQKSIGGNWVSKQIVVNQEITIPARSSVDISSYWNSQDVVVGEVGEYRVYGRFDVEDEFKENDWEFVVETRDFTCADTEGCGGTGSGVVSYYKFDEDSGNMAEDSANANDGMIYGASFVNGKSGKALHFDGKDDYVKLGASNSLIKNPSSWTISGWFKADSIPNSGLNEKGGRIITFHRSSTRTAVSFMVSSKRNEFSWAGVCYSAGSGSGGDVCSSIPFTYGSVFPNTWYFFTVTYDGTNIKMYLNDNFPTVVSKAPPTFSVDSAFVGRGEDSGSYYFNGTIDEVKIWDRVLSEEEIRTEYDCAECSGGGSSGSGSSGGGSSSSSGLFDIF